MQFENLELIHYELTDEPIGHRYVRRLSKTVQEKISRLHDEAQQTPEKAIPQLLKIKEKYPHVPLIYNYLAVAYSQVGEDEKAEAIIMETIRKHPDYFFARLNYAQICLSNGKYHKIPEIFGHKYDLKKLYPKRKRFHITEFINFFALMGIYFSRTDQKDIAKRYYHFLRDIGSEYRIVKQLKQELYPGILYRFLKLLLT